MINCGPFTEQMDFQLDSRAAAKGFYAALSPIQLLILWCLSRGFNQPAIAEKLYMTRQAVSLSIHRMAKISEEGNAD